MTLPILTNFSELNAKLLLSSKMPKKRGKLYVYVSKIETRLFLSNLLFRQRKLKEAREAAESEVAKYRK